MTEPQTPAKQPHWSEQAVAALISHVQAHPQKPKDVPGTFLGIVRRAWCPGQIAKIEISDLVFTRTEIVPFQPHGEHQGGFVLRWGTQDIGFGEITFLNQADNTVKVHTECMSPAFVRRVVDELLQHAVYDNE